MNRFNRKASALAGVLAVGAFGTLSVHAVEAPQESANAESCQMEARRIAVWSHGPFKRVLETPRYVTQTRLVCDDEAQVVKPARAALAQSYGPRQR
jgi:hypothetical protein